MPDVGSACKTCYSNKKPCNFFVRDVAAIVHVKLPSYGTADDLVSAAAFHWISLTEVEAMKAAERGEFVIAGMSSNELNQSEGHVAVVMPGIANGFPKVASTNEGKTPWGKSMGNNPLTHVFPANAVRAGRVRYFTPPSRGTTGSW